MCSLIILFTVYTGSLITIIMTGIESSTSANGPCFNSPAMIPSLCMYVSSFTFCKDTDWSIRKLRLDNQTSLLECG